MDEVRFELATAMIDGRASPCLVVEGRYWPLDAAAGFGEGRGLIGLFDDWDRSLRALAAMAARCRDTAEGALTPDRLLTPLQWPGKVLCAGANYYDHMEEMGFPVANKSDQRLFFFFKPPRTALVGPGRTVRMPRDTGAFDWEVELAVVIGRTATAVAPAQAMAHIAAYAVGIDLSARDLNRQPEQFYKFDWVAGKAQDTCAPLGPHLVPAAFVPNPMDRRIWLKVNGETKQDGTTANMIYDIAEQISLASRIMTLEPGDILFTGTPAGVGAPKKTFLKVGDVIEAGVEGVGSFSVEIGPPT